MNPRLLGLVRLALILAVLACLVASWLRAQHDGVTLLGLLFGAALVVAMRVRPRDVESPPR